MCMYYAHSMCVYGFMYVMYTYMEQQKNFESGARLEAQDILAASSSMNGWLSSGLSMSHELSSSK